jgi:hypothetical protein
VSVVADHIGETVCFCTRCGALADTHRRVCDGCGMGVVLSCPRDALPAGAAAFVICTHELIVSAVSEAGEPIFGAEDAVAGAHLLDLVTSPLGDEQVTRHAGVAAQRPTDPIAMPLRLRAEGGQGLGTLTARIASCGPPRAALVTVEPSAFGRR